MVFVIPKSGYIICDPYQDRPLPPDGAEVDGDAYFWARMIRDGDVTVAAPEEETTADEPHLDK